MEDQAVRRHPRGWRTKSAWVDREVGDQQPTLLAGNLRDRADVLQAPQSKTSRRLQPREEQPVAPVLLDVEIGLGEELVPGCNR